MPAELEDAAIQAVEAGTDMDLGANAYRRLVKAVQAGKVKESAINRAVSNVASQIPDGAFRTTLCISREAAHAWLTAKITGCWHVKSPREGTVAEEQRHPATWKSETHCRHPSEC